MTNGCNYNKPATYQIQIKGNLDSTWSDWFDGFNITCQEGKTILIGPVPDQAALHGILSKINDLGLAIISVYELPVMESGLGTIKKGSSDE